MSTTTRLQQTRPAEWRILIGNRQVGTLRRSNERGEVVWTAYRPDGRRWGCGFTRRTLLEWVGRQG